MEIVCIFGGQLTAVRYGVDQPDEFSQLFCQWQDGFFGTISLKAAIKRTRYEARKLEQTLLQLAPESHQDLDSIFKPLQPRKPIELARSKATGQYARSWLRIYAIKLQSNVYMITGGAIKLTATMQDRDHTLYELAKLSRCKNYLREQGIVDIKGISELIIQL